jgi:hypothetical protein
MSLLLLLLLLLLRRVRDVCIQRGEVWCSSLAKAACSEQDYYEQLVATYEAWARVSCAGSREQKHAGRAARHAVPSSSMHW